MTLQELFRIQDPIVLAIAAGVILFTALTILLKPAFKKNKGISVAIAIILSILTTRNLYQNRFYGLETQMALILTLVVLALFLKIIWGFARHTKTSFGH